MIRNKNSHVYFERRGLFGECYKGDMLKFNVDKDTEECGVKP